MIIIISENESGQRFDRFLRKYFKNNQEIKLGDIYLWIRKGVIKVNGRKYPEEKKLVVGDEIKIENDEQLLKSPLNSFLSKNKKKQQLKIQDIKELIVYEDENWIFFDKPHGIVIHPGNKHIEDITFNEYLEVYINYLIKESKFEIKSTTFFPSFCFRLDKDTSGIIIAGKNYNSLKYLNELIRLRKTNKSYISVVRGTVPKRKIIQANLIRGFNTKSGKSQTYIDEFEGSEAKTEINLIKSFKDKYLGYISIIEAKIYTGRMHQIRAHLAHIGHPVIGDLTYGDQTLNKIAKNNHKIVRQLLHSWKYGFYDKFKQKNIEIESNIPNDIKTFI